MAVAEIRRAGVTVEAPLATVADIASAPVRAGAVAIDGAPLLAAGAEQEGRDGR
jgi:hypothetical protein